jgi:hypothetical protein
VHVNRFENSIALAKASWQVLRDDKQLAVLPLLSLLASLLVVVSFLIPVALIAHNGTDGYSAKPVDWILAAIGYLVLTYVVVFFNAALVFAADARLHGRPVTLGDAIHAARSRAGVLLPWVVVSATVSIVLRAIEERAGIVGRIVGAFAGMAWSVVTFLVLPILVFEGIGPIDAVKRSGQLFRKTWGENLIANAGIGLATMIVGIVGAIPLFLLVMVGGPVAVVGIAALVVWFLAVGLVSATLTGILQTALYRFATGEAVPGFDGTLLRGAFRQRGNRNGNTWIG